MKKPTIAIILEGGVVQDVVSDEPKAASSLIEDIIIIDYDAKGPDSNATVRQDDGSDAEAWVYSSYISKARIGIDDIKYKEDQDPEC